MDKLKIGKFLRKLREKKGKTQNAVALELVDYGIDVSDKTIAKWEKGNYPDFENLDVIADYYGVRPADILDGEIYVKQNFEDKYFIVNNEWLSQNDLENPYYIRIEQENDIKKRVKYLILELIRTKSLTRMQNDELNFLLLNFYNWIQSFKKKMDHPIRATLQHLEIIIKTSINQDCGDESLATVVCEWKNSLSESTLKHIFSTDTNQVLNVLLSMDDFDSEKLVISLCKTVMSCAS